MTEPHHEPAVESVKPVRRPFISVDYNPPLIIIGSVLIHVILPFPHRAGVRPYTSSFDLAESCVFNKQSPPPVWLHSTIE